MKASLIFLSILFVVPLSLYAQVNNAKTVADFRGTWEFETSTDSLLSGKGGLSKYKSSLTIAQTASELVIRDKFFLELYNSRTGARKTIWDEESSSKYYVDGRG